MKVSRAPRIAPIMSARVQTGEIPWSVEELGEVLDHAAKLHNTPHDDWDRREKGLHLVAEDGSVSRIVFNPDMLPNQLMDFLIARLRAKGVSEEVIMSHGWRFMESMAFLGENKVRLRQEKLIVDDDTDADANMISVALVQLLATSKYEGVKMQAGEPVRCFHLERVITEAKRRHTENDGTSAH